MAASGVQPFHARCGKVGASVCITAVHVVLRSHVLS
jgi:hypothetical protein